MIITLRVRTSFSLLFSLFLLLLRHLFYSSFFLLFASFSLIFFLLLFFGFLLTFFYKYVLYLFFKCTLNTVLEKCTWYLTKQHWGIVRTIQIMRYYTYLNIKCGYVNKHGRLLLIAPCDHNAPQWKRKFGCWFVIIDISGPIGIICIVD